jgi:hypothetical protein
MDGMILSTVPILISLSADETEHFVALGGQQSPRYRPSRR